MTDRVKGFTVALEKDLREDDASEILRAISMLRGVANVTPQISTHVDWINRQQLRVSIAEKIIKAINGEDDEHS